MPQATAPAAPAGAAVQGTRVEIDTDQGLFWFEPRRCAVGQDPDSGVVEFSIEGAGQAPDGTPVYVTMEDEDGDPAFQPELRINVGTDQPRKTPDVVWAANEQTSRGLQVPATQGGVQGKQVTFEGVVFSRSGTDRLVAKAPIRVDCAQTGRR